LHTLIDRVGSLYYFPPGAKMGHRSNRDSALAAVCQPSRNRRLVKEKPLSAPRARQKLLREIRATDALSLLEGDVERLYEEFRANSGKNWSNEFLDELSRVADALNRLVEGNEDEGGGQESP
jgi:hypothetical protein